MDAFKNFMKTTIVGGLIFLIPLILLLLVLKHAMGFAAKVAKPIAEKFPVPEIGGPALVTLVAVAVLIVVAFLAGLAARTSPRSSQPRTCCLSSCASTIAGSSATRSRNCRTAR